ncbi:ABC transporter ATP-binding protein [Candidatus Gracilibacteria bacterium]|nr:ABC transporter ATP-binding protein [Candidatus Gracilibacteria bacterium]
MHRSKLKKTRIIASILLGIVAIGLWVTTFALIYLIIIEIIKPDFSRSYLQQIALTIFFVLLLRWICLGIAGTCSHLAAYYVLHDLRLKIAQKLSELPLGYFSHKQTGAIKQVINEDVDYFEEFIAHVIPETIGSVVTITLTIIYLLTIDWRLTLATLAGIPLVILSQIFLFKDLEPLTKGYNEALEKMNSSIIEYVQGMSVVKAFANTTESYAKYSNAVIDYHEYEEKWARKTVLPWTAFTVSLTANIATILIVGIWLLEKGSLSLATLVLFLVLGLGITAPLLRLVQYSEIFLRVREGANRIQDLLQELSIAQTNEPKTVRDLTLEFRGVDFAYEKELVLKGIDFKVLPQTTTALVGPSGSGKTTITRLIPRFWDIEIGEILLGGVNIKDLSLDYLMSQITFVFQDVVLFDDTIYENIAMGKLDAPGEAVIEAAKLAQCDDFINELPDGYQTVIGEKGRFLSGGQKQRIAIARAILKDAPIVILDEATAFIDPENEVLIQSALSQLVSQKTLIIIAHRLGTIVNADQILVVDRGEIIDRGTHSELLINNRLYQKMWNAYVQAQQWSFQQQSSDRHGCF